jgi:carbon-monoxide dehydrogenase small subunit
MLMQASWLIANNDDPSEDEIREGIAGNLCRCTGYVNIVKSIQQAAGEMRTAKNAPAEPAAAR